MTAPGQHHADLYWTPEEEREYGRVFTPAEICDTCSDIPAGRLVPVSFCPTALADSNSSGYPYVPHSGSERAIRRALRDINDGHIALIVTVELFDTTTGARHPQPRILGVACDRIPNGVPNRDADWWDVLVERGWLDLVVSRMSHYRPSEAGLQALADLANTPY